MRRRLVATLAVTLLMPCGFRAFAQSGASRTLSAQQADTVQVIIAHRGSSIDRPENTLAAYQRAYEAGAQAIEVDLRLTREGYLVSLHDPVVDRTTNGSGPVSSLTLAEVKALDAGSKFSPRYQNARIPTFQEILVLAKGKLHVFLDLKGTGNAYREQVAREVRAYGEPQRILLGVRNHEDIDFYRKALPEARMVGLLPNPQSLEDFLAAGVTTIRLWPDWLNDAALVDRFSKSGAALLTNAGKGTPEELEPLLTYRPTMLFTDDPASVSAQLQQLRQANP